MQTPDPHLVFAAAHHDPGVFQPVRQGDGPVGRKPKLVVEDARKNLVQLGALERDDLGVKVLKGGAVRNLRRPQGLVRRPLNLALQNRLGDLRIRLRPKVNAVLSAHLDPKGDLLFDSLVQFVRHAQVIDAILAQHLTLLK